MTMTLKGETYGFNPRPLHDSEKAHSCAYRASRRLRKDVGWSVYSSVISISKTSAIFLELRICSSTVNEPFGLALCALRNAEYFSPVYIRVNSHAFALMLCFSVIFPSSGKKLSVVLREYSWRRAFSIFVWQVGETVSSPAS